MTGEELEQAFLRLAESGEFDRILGQLRGRWDRVPRERVREALQDAAEEIVKRQQAGQTITNVAGLLSTIARRRLSALWEEMQHERDVATTLAMRARHADAWQHDEERSERIQRAVAYVRRLAQRIDSANHRRTLLTLIDAAADGLQLENKELADILGCIPNTAGMWKLRALQRVRVLLEEEGAMSWEEITEMIPLPEDEQEEDQDHDGYYGEDDDDE